MADGFTIGLWTNQQTDLEFIRTLLSTGFVEGPPSLKLRLEQVVKNLDRDGHGSRDGYGRTPSEADADRVRICEKKSDLGE